MTDRRCLLLLYAVYLSEGLVFQRAWVKSLEIHEYYLYLLGPNRHVNYQHRKRIIVHQKLHRGEKLPYLCLLLLSHEKNDVIMNCVQDVSP